MASLQKYWRTLNLLERGLFALSVLCFAWALVAYIQAKHFQYNAQTIIGQITGLKVLPNDDGKIITPTFKFELQGKRFEVLNPHMADAEDYRVGQSVSVLANPMNPKDAILEETFHPAITSLIIAALGFIGIASCGLVLFARLRHVSKSK